MLDNTPLKACPSTLRPAFAAFLERFHRVGSLGTNTIYWTNLSNGPPACGTAVYVWNPVIQDYAVYTFGSGGWSPSAPVVGVGQSALVKIGTDTNCTPCTNNLVINGSFELPCIGADTVNQSPSTPGWTATTAGNTLTTLELWSGSFLAWRLKMSYQHLEINSATYNVIVSQVITNVSTNCTAKFCFWYAGRARHTPNDFQVEVRGSGVTSATLNPPSYTNTNSRQQYCIEFVPVSTTLTIRFTGTSGTVPAGAHIDNVSLMQCCVNLPCTNTVTVVFSTNKTVACNTAWNFDAPVITEAGGGSNYLVSYTTTPSGPCPYSEITRNWVITDACGNTNYCIQTVAVTNPVPLLNCATNKTVQCGSAWSFDPPTVVNGSCNTTTTVLNTVTNASARKTSRGCGLYRIRAASAISAAKLFRSSIPCHRLSTVFPIRQSSATKLGSSTCRRPTTIAVQTPQSASSHPTRLSSTRHVPPYIAASGEPWIAAETLLLARNSSSSPTPSPRRSAARTT